MAQCIFCDVELDGNTKPEHILQNALGGRKTTRNAICSECNNTFGGTIDKELAEQFAEIRNLLRLRSGSGQAAPTLRKQKAGDHLVHLGGDGTIRPAGKPFVVSQTPEGVTRIDIRGESLKQIEKDIPHMAAAAGVSEDRLRLMLSEQELFSIEKRPGTIGFNLSFGGPEAIRSATKACLTLWTTLVGDDEVRGEPYDEARRYVRFGDLAFHNSKVKLDSRFHRYSDYLTEKYGPAANLIYVGSDNEGRVVGYFSVLSLVSFIVVLADSGGTPNQKVAIVNDPRSGEWTDQIATSIHIDVDWLTDWSQADFEEVAKQRLDALHRYYHTSETERQRDYIFKSIIEEFGVGMNQPISPAIAQAIAISYVDRLNSYFSGQPTRKRIANTSFVEPLKNGALDDSI